MAKVLLVDDNEDLLNFFSALFQLMGYDVIIAADKKALYMQLEETLPDIIILDVMLGGTDGRLLCIEIKDKHKNIPVILMSASNGHLKDYQECSADFALEKPFDIRTVKETISLALTKYHKESSIAQPGTLKNFM